MENASHGLVMILPALVLLGAGLFAVAWDLFLPKTASKAAIEWTAYLGVIGSFACVYLWMSAPAESVFSNALVVDKLARFASLTVLAAALLAIVLSVDYVTARGVPLAEYVGLVMLASAGMMFLAMAADLITMFLAIEIMSIAIYVLCGITRTDGRSIEAAVKYFVQGAFATAFLLYGMALLYGATGTLQLRGIWMAIEGPVSPMALAGMGLLMAGFLFKIGAAPFHAWVPDVYEGAPASVTAFMSVAVKAAGFAAMVRVFVGGLGDASAAWTPVAVGVSALTMIWGNLGAVTQKSVKRMLAYSSVAHTGYALVGLACVGTAGPSASLFYLFVYTFMTLGAFAMLIFAGKGGKDAETYEELAGLARRRPWAALFMTVFMVSLAGVPPLAGFFGKFVLFRAAVMSGQTALAILGIVTSVIGAYYYLRVVVVMYMREPVETPAEGEKEAGSAPAFDFNVGVAVFVAALLTLAFGVWPNQYINMAGNSIPEQTHTLVAPRELRR
jgi:NADH-quinone oxidoreductase subunit N